MSKIVALKNLVKDTRGATLVEYVMLAGLVALICIAAFTAFGSTIASKVHGQVTTVGALNTGTGS
jgi:pilus assembly protein Flp/PilA